MSTEESPDVPPPSLRGTDGAPRRARWLRRLYMTLRTEHTTPGKIGLAVGVGVFVGCSPFWGLHLAMAFVAATFLRLNRVLVYAATNLANPLTAPPLIFAEIQVGHRLLRGQWLGLSLDELADAGASGLFVDFLVGGLLLGILLAASLGALAYAIVRSGRLPESYQPVVDGVVQRYLAVSIRDAEAARWRLVRDPIFPELLADPDFRAAGRVLDLGCGRGLLAAVPASAPGFPPRRSYLGIDESERYVRVAREALGDLPAHAFEARDLRDLDPPPADLVLLVDVLRFLPPGSQDALLRRLGRALEPGARVLVREADASAGAAFLLVRARDALARLIPGRPAHRFGYRRAADLRNALLAAGFEVRDRTTTHAKSPAWVLLEATRTRAAAHEAESEIEEPPAAWAELGIPR